VRPRRPLHEPSAKKEWSISLLHVKGLASSSAISITLRLQRSLVGLAVDPSQFAYRQRRYLRTTINNSWNLRSEILATKLYMFVIEAQYDKRHSNV
jgi:hypothetical protein